MVEYRFVLVHGSWHDGSLWKPVADHLGVAGHHVTTPTIAGHGKNTQKAGIEHSDCVASIVEHIVDGGLDDVVLVGHSFGGTVIARVAMEIPERIRRLVFWNAFVPEDGNSLNDEIPPTYRELFASLAGSTDDNTIMLPFPIWREAFINDADEALARSSYELLSPEPYQPFLDKLDLGGFYKLETPRSYLNCTEDNALPQGAEWGWHPRMSSRLGLYRLVQMPGSHEVVFSNPGGLAQKLIEAGRD
jgi:pimeloyl-ACP methyl ester carboxylesterase